MSTTSLILDPEIFSPAAPPTPPSRFQRIGQVIDPVMPLYDIANATANVANQGINTLNTYRNQPSSLTPVIYTASCGFSIANFFLSSYSLIKTGMDVHSMALLRAWDYLGDQLLSFTRLLMETGSGILGFMKFVYHYLPKAALSPALVLMFGPILIGVAFVLLPWSIIKDVVGIYRTCKSLKKIQARGDVPVRHFYYKLKVRDLKGKLRDDYLLQQQRFAFLERSFGEGGWSHLQKALQNENASHHLTAAKKAMNRKLLDHALNLVASLITLAAVVIHVVAPHAILIAYILFAISCSLLTVKSAYAAHTYYTWKRELNISEIANSQTSTRIVPYKNRTA